MQVTFQFQQNPIFRGNGVTPGGASRIILEL